MVLNKNIFLCFTSMFNKILVSNMIVLFEKIQKRKEREDENIFSKGLCNSIDLDNLS